MPPAVTPPTPAGALLRPLTMVSFRRQGASASAIAGKREVLAAATATAAADLPVPLQVARGEIHEQGARRDGSRGLRPGRPRWRHRLQPGQRQTVPRPAQQRPPRQPPAPAWPGHGAGSSGCRRAVRNSSLRAIRTRWFFRRKPSGPERLGQRLAPPAPRSGWSARGPQRRSATCGSGRPGTGDRPSAVPAAVRCPGTSRPTAAPRWCRSGCPRSLDRWAPMPSKISRPKPTGFRMS